MTLASLYKIGESILASVVNVTARLKVRLTIKPEIVNKEIPEIKSGILLQGSIASVEDEGYIIDIGQNDSKGFLISDKEEPLPVGKFFIFKVKEVLLDGRQVTLEIANLNEQTEDVESIEYIIPGMKVNFKSVKQFKSGFVGKIFKNFGSTLHLLQV